MSDDLPPPRKRLRFFSKGKQKLNAIFGSKSKSGKGRVQSEDFDDEVETESSLLSRINIPATNTVVKAKSVDTNLIHDDSRMTVPDSGDEKISEPQNYDVCDEYSTEHLSQSEKRIKASRRIGFVGIETIQEERYHQVADGAFPLCGSSTISANGKALAIQPRALTSRFSFQSPSSVKCLSQKFRGQDSTDHGPINSKIEEPVNSHWKPSNEFRLSHSQKTTTVLISNPLLLPLVEDVSRFVRTPIETPRPASSVVKSSQPASERHPKLQHHSILGELSKEKRCDSGEHDVNPALIQNESGCRSTGHNRNMMMTDNINVPNRGVTNLPLHATKRPAQRFNTLMDETSPSDNAYLVARKRKRLANAILSPPTFNYQHSGDPNFNIFQNGFLLYPDLCLALASHMSVGSLVSLYAISRDFHTIIDQRFTTVVLNQATRKAYESSHVFSFRCYAHFCRSDPGLRFPHPNPRMASMGYSRMVPSFRWLKFVLYREKTIQEIMAVFAERGCPLPPHCSLAMKRMWFLFDIPDNARRIGFIHNRSLFTDLDLYFAMCFIVKLDMLCNDPIANEKRDHIRKMLMSSVDGFTTIAKVLKRETWANEVDTLRAYIRSGSFVGNMVIPADITDIFGIPVGEVGSSKKEFWGFKKESSERPLKFLLRPDQLITRETIRRGYRFGNHFLRCLQYGYFQADTLEACEPRKLGRRIFELEEEEYDLDDVVGGVRALAVEDGGDVLLDLGNTWKGSKYCVEQEKTNSREMKDRSEEQERIASYTEAWMTETQ